METKLPFPTDNIYKFFAVGGLLTTLAGFIGGVWINERANERIAQDYSELAGIQGTHALTAEQAARKPLLQRKVEITVADRKAGVQVSLAFGSLGLLAMIYGFRKWHTEVQPMLDETTRVQLAIARCQLAKAAAENLAAGCTNSATSESAKTPEPDQCTVQPTSPVVAANVDEVDGPCQVPSLDELVAAPTTSRWLSAALASALDRDPVDAANDADLLQKVLASRATAVLEAHLQELAQRPSTNAAF